MIRITILEDEKKQRSILKKYLNDYQKEHQDTSFMIEEYENSHDLLKQYRCDTDILILDIYLEDMLGTDLLSIGVSRLTKGINYDIQPSILENLYNIVCGFLFVFLQFDIAHRFKLVGDVATMQQIVRQQHLQYEKSKENVQLINEKYHDLKKMINSMKGYVNTQELEELEKKVSEYAPHISTGKEVIDVILNEKRMICEKQNIRITSLVGGSDLDFVQELDLYALFSNALENAMDAVSKLSPEEERYINLSVSRTNDMVVIHVENPYDGTIISENGLPKSNRDPRYHGFGMASMERIAEQYGGSISVSTIGNRFCLDIILFDT